MPSPDDEEIDSKLLSVTVGEEITLVVAAVSDSHRNQSSRREWSKGIRAIGGSVAITYKLSDDALTPPDAPSAVQMNKDTRFIVPFKVPTKFGQEWLNEAYKLDVELTSDKIEPRRDTSHMKVVHLHCKLPVTAPAKLELVLPVESAGKAAGCMAESSSEEVPCHISVMNGDELSFKVRILDANDDPVAKTHYDWGLTAKIAQPEAASGLTLSGSLSAEVSDTGIADFSKLRVVLTEQSTLTESPQVLQLQLYAAPPRRSNAVPKPLGGVFLELSVLVTPSRLCTSLELSLRQPSGLLYPTLNLLEVAAAAVQRSRKSRKAKVAAAPEGESKKYELVGYAKTTINTVEVLAHSAGGQLSSSEIEIEIEGLEGLEGLEGPEIRQENGADGKVVLLLPELQLSKDVQKLFLTVIERKSGTSVPLVLNIVPDTRDIKARATSYTTPDPSGMLSCAIASPPFLPCDTWQELTWALKCPTPIPADATWGEYVELSMVDPHGNPIETSCESSDVYLHVKGESGDDVDLSSRVADLQDGLARNGVLITAHSTGEGPKSSEPAVASIVAGKPQKAWSCWHGMQPSEGLRVLNCTMLPNIDVELQDNCGNPCINMTDSFTARIEPSSELSGFLNGEFCPMEVTGKGRLTIGLYQRLLRLRDGLVRGEAGDTCHLPTTFKLHTSVSSASEDQFQQEQPLSVVVSAGKHPIKLECPEPPAWGHRGMAATLLLWIGAVKLRFLCEVMLLCKRSPRKRGLASGPPRASMCRRCHHPLLGFERSGWLQGYVQLALVSHVHTSARRRTMPCCQRTKPRSLPTSCSSHGLLTTATQRRHTRSCISVRRWRTTAPLRSTSAPGMGRRSLDATRFAWAWRRRASSRKLSRRSSHSSSFPACRPCCGWARPKKQGRCHAQWRWATHFGTMAWNSKRRRLAPSRPPNHSRSIAATAVATTCPFRPTQASL